jgi:ubiquinone biosynthesis protein UbiJ
MPMSAAERLSAPFLASLQRALDSLIAARARTRERVGALAGRTVAVTFAELGLTLAFTGEDGRLVVRRGDDTTVPAPDATLRGTSAAFLGAFLREGAAEATTLPPGISVDGDALLVRDLRALLADLEFDWEERASGLVGDAAAHQLARAARAFGGWTRYAGDRLTRDVAEYLREETRDLVARDEVARFNDGVDQVRDGVERAAARLALIEQRIDPVGAAAAAIAPPGAPPGSAGPRA